jgi:TP901 family phage tail tape measure protein
MGFSQRELALLITAEDQASGKITSLAASMSSLSVSSSTAGMNWLAAGYALNRVGDSLGNLGQQGLRFFNDATQDAIDYSKGAALAATQSQRLGISLADITTIGRSVGRDVPIAIDQINPALYDIFSTVSATIPEATDMLTQFGKASIAGGVDVQNTSRLTMAALNAWQRPLSETTKMLDIQFKTAELGGRTFEEITGAMARAVPATRAANGSFEDLGGMMAFLTANGLSAEMSATSAARAFDTIANPKSVRNLEAYGVSVRDASGNFRSMSDIITQLAENKGWASMTGPERKEAFVSIFGTGTAQARRFFDLAIPNYQQFNSLTDQVQDSAGAMGRAYDIMFEQPATQAQLLQNKYELLRQEIGDQLIPAKLRLMEVLGSLMDAWNSLDPGVRKVIVTFLVAASAFLAIVGPIIAVIGSVMMFVGAMKMAGIGIGALASGMGIALVVIALLAGAAYLIYRNWDTIGPLFWKVWDSIKSAFQSAWDFIQPILETFINGVRGFWEALNGEGLTSDGFVGAMERIGLYIRENIIPVIQELWDKFLAFANWFADEAWPKIVDAAQFAWDKLTAFWDWLTNSAVPAVVDFGQKVVDAFQWLWDKAVEVYNWFSDNFGPGFQKIWDSLKENIPPIIDEIKETWQSLVDKWNETYPLLEEGFNRFMIAMNFLKDVVVAVWGFISPFIEVAMSVIRTAIDAGMSIISTVWSAAWELIKSLVVIAWNLISSVIAAAIAIISNIIQLGLNIIQGDWGEAWQNIKNILSAVWDIIKAVISAAWEVIKALFRAAYSIIKGIVSDFVTWLWDKIKAMMDGFKDKVTSGWETIKSIFKGMPETIKGFFSGAASWLYDAGKAILSGLIDGITNKIQSLKDKLSSVTRLIPDWKGPSEVDKRLLFGSGQMIMQGLEGGLANGWRDVHSYLSGLTTSANFMPNVSVSAGIGTKVMGADDSNVLAALIKVTDTGMSNNDKLIDAVERLIEAVREGNENPTVVMAGGSSSYWYDSENSGA